MSGSAQISRQDYKRAQRAIARGDARPLQEVLGKVQARRPGKLLQVGFPETRGRPIFQVLIVDSKGAVVSVTVDAGSGRITNMQAC
ncbi:PepSY domain-containing protein [Ruegeria arenilitoris]|uniref:PepSY domain-containing protein n=1 Tax=Ruegeria arenilitoris TaxID=1173585 RepID=UPI00147A5EE0|nr:PepSY domain-containing protein [Ruegeria arenilitoris]